MTPATTAARVLVRILEARGVDRVFCVAGESFLAVLDALYSSPSIGVVTCRHEGSAAFMAAAGAKLSGRAGVCFVNRGPGATNAAIALHSAEQDGTPMVLFMGQVHRGEIGRRAFQEIDAARTFGDISKGVWVVYEAESLAEVVVRAFQVAEAGTPGPVVVVLPEDLLSQPIAPESAQWPALPGLRPCEPSAADVVAVAERLARAQRPLMIAGGLLSRPEGRRALLECAEAQALPVVTSNKRQDIFGNEHPCYAGHLNIASRKPQVQRFDEADLILAVGTRLGDITTQGYTFPRRPRPRQPLIHVHPEPRQLGEMYETELAFACDPAAFLRALARQSAPPPSAERRGWIQGLHELENGLAAWQEEEPAGAGVDLGALVTALSRHASDDAVITIDAGNFTSWVHRYFRFRPTQTLLAVTSSAMGFGVPSGVAAALRSPDTQVVVFVGDGGFLMTGNELATAVQYGAPVRIVVVNNGSYGTIRHHQERTFPGRVIATDLRNPDFAELARAFGATGLTITGDAQIEPVLRQALACPGPVVIEVRTSLERISAYQTIPGLRSPAPANTPADTPVDTPVDKEAG
jgi:acetolactate synthase-1/2/3 large subunit